MLRCAAAAVTTSATAYRSAPHTAACLQLVIRLKSTTSSGRKMASAAAQTVTVRVPAPVVSVSWLKSHYDSVKVVDGSWYMPNEKRDPAGEHVQARLPGARFFDLEACTSKEGPNANLPHMLPSKEQ